MQHEWYTAAVLSGLPGLPGTARGIRDWMSRHRVKSQSRRHGKGLEYHVSGIPEETLSALGTSASLTCGPVQDKPIGTDAAVPGASKANVRPLDKLPETTRTEAYRRAAAALAVQRLVDEGSTIVAALNGIARARSISVTTLRNWYLRVRNLPQADWAVTLASRRGGLHKDPAVFSPEAWDYIKADYLRPEQPCLNACYLRLLRVAKDKDWQIPSYRTVARRIDALPWEMVALARQGEDALLRRLPVMTRTRGHLSAMQAVNADGHKFDVRCNLPSGTVGRPMLTAWQDLYSGKILAWRISETLNQHHVRLSFGDMVEKYGVPRHAYLDNGREFANKWLTGKANFRFRFTVREEDPVGIFAQLGVEAHWTTPYHGQSKPIERAFRDLCECIAKHPQNAGAYTGNSPMTKPDNYGSRAVQWDDFCALVDREIAAHNARTGRRTETAKGRSFDLTFSDSYTRSTVSRATPEQRRLWLLAAEGVMVRNTGHVAILGNAYWGEALPPLAGKRVVVRFDPEHLERPVSVYDAEGVLLCEASRTIAAFDDAEAAKEHARANRHRVKATREMLAAERRMDVLEAAAMLPDDPLSREGGNPDELVPGVTRLVLPPRRKAVNAAEWDTPVSDETRQQENTVLNMLDDWAANRFALGGQ